MKKYEELGGWILIAGLLIAFSGISYGFINVFTTPAPDAVSNTMTLVLYGIVCAMCGGVVMSGID